MSRASLIEAYIAALPFTAVAVMQTAGGCRVETCAPGAPGGTIAKLYYFKPSHVDLVLGAAGLADGPVDQPPDAVAALIEHTARAMHAPYETETELRAAAAQEVDKVVAKVQVMRCNGEMKEINAKYKAYRLARVSRGEKAKPYSAYLAHITAGMVRGAAMTGRMV